MIQISRSGGGKFGDRSLERKQTGKNLLAQSAKLMKIKIKMIDKIMTSESRKHIERADEKKLGILSIVTFLFDCRALLLMCFPIIS